MQPSIQNGGSLLADTHSIIFGISVRCKNLYFDVIQVTSTHNQAEAAGAGDTTKLQHVVTNICFPDPERVTATMCYFLLSNNHRQAPRHGSGSVTRQQPVSR